MISRNTMRASSFQYSVGLYILFNCLFLALVLLKPGSSHVFEITDDVGQAVGWLLGSLLCLVGLVASWKSVSALSPPVGRIEELRRWVPIFLAVGIFCQFIGQAIYTYYDIHHWTNFPSLADAGYLSTFPFFCVGILLLPTRPPTGTSRPRVLLNSFIIMTAIITFSWYFVLGPTMLQGEESLFAKCVGSAYPFFDLVLIFSVIRLAIRPSELDLRLTIRLLIAGLVIIVITDSIYDYQTLQGTYVNGWQDAGWPIGYMLLGLAAQAWNVARRQARNEAGSISFGLAPQPLAEPSGSWYIFLPYILLPAVAMLLIYVWREETNRILAQGVYIGGATLSVLIVLRQLVVSQEMFFYNRQLRKTKQELYEKNEALHLANMQLEEQAAQLETAYEKERLLNELKDQFLLNVNHELRTPLTEIHGYLNLLIEYKENLDEETRTAFIEHAVHGSEELLHLVSNVLDAIPTEGQRHAPDTQTLCVVEVINDAIAVFNPQKHLEHPLILRVSDALTAQADRHYLHQVLLNLIANAFKYSPAGTPIIISASLQRREAREDSVEQDSFAISQVCVSIQDAGPGIPLEEIPLLFGKFVRLKRDLIGAIRGTGLGLYISKQLVESMGGRIWVESAGIAGQGSRFSFTLPSYDPTTMTQEEQISNSEIIH